MPSQMREILRAQRHMKAWAVHRLIMHYEEELPKTSPPFTLKRQERKNLKVENTKEKTKVILRRQTTTPKEKTTKKKTKEKMKEM